jgi:hypothetical protein
LFCIKLILVVVGEEPSEQEFLPQDIVDPPQEPVIPELSSANQPVEEEPVEAEELVEAEEPVEEETPVAEEEPVEEEIVAPINDNSEPEPTFNEETIESFPNQECISAGFIVANHM